MTKEAKDDQSPKIIIDSDWKQDAADEKARLEEETKDVAAHGPLPPASFAEIVNMIVMQATISLGGFKTPAGETVPRDLEAAKHYVDLLDVLNEKIKGNTTDDEQHMMDAVLHELRLHYVQAMSAPPPAGPTLKPH